MPLRLGAVCRRVKQLHHVSGCLEAYRVSSSNADAKVDHIIQKKGVYEKYKCGEVMRSGERSVSINLIVTAVRSFARALQNEKA